MINEANSRRTSAATSMNKTSSRSHMILTYYLTLVKTHESGGHKFYSRVNFIDLAGSEKVKKTGATGARLKEAQAINQGLSTLARVIEAIVKKRRSVPFRDSLLTWILKDSLMGNCRTTLVVACSPHVFNRQAPCLTPLICTRFAFLLVFFAQTFSRHMHKEKRFKHQNNAGKKRSPHVDSQPVVN